MKLLSMKTMCYFTESYFWNTKAKSQIIKILLHARGKLKETKENLSLKD